MTSERLGKLTGLSADEAQAEVEKAERNGVILGYRTIIDWDRTDEDLVQAGSSCASCRSKDGLRRCQAAHLALRGGTLGLLLSGSYDVGLIVAGTDDA